MPVFISVIAYYCLIICKSMKLQRVMLDYQLFGIKNKSAPYYDKDGYTYIGDISTITSVIAGQRAVVKGIVRLTIDHVKWVLIYLMKRFEEVMVRYI